MSWSFSPLADVWLSILIWFRVNGIARDDCRIANVVAVGERLAVSWLEAMTTRELVVMKSLLGTVLLTGTITGEITWEGIAQPREKKMQVMKGTQKLRVQMKGWLLPRNHAKADNDLIRKKPSPSSTDSSEV